MSTAFDARVGRDFTRLTRRGRARTESKTAVRCRNCLVIPRLAEQSVQALWRAYAFFLSKMVLRVNFIARCTLFIPEKCYCRVFHIGANALVSNAPGRCAASSNPAGRAKSI
jgi:hypothetical protein